MALGVFAAIQTVEAGFAGRRGKSALLRAEQHLSQRDLDPARQELMLADRSFATMRDEFDDLGPLLTVARYIPVVRSQVLGIEALRDAGSMISVAGLRLSTAAEEIKASSDRGVPLSDALDQLQTIRTSLRDGVSNLDTAHRRVASVDGRWLIGPLGEAQDELSRRLPDMVQRATSAEQGMAAFIAFAGGDRPRRYLFLSQNPDEIRPTGGFIGMFGVLTANSAQLNLEQFQDITVFLTRYPQVAIPGLEAGSPFSLAVPPRPQSLGNVNHTPDWPQSARLAKEMWDRSGQEPVDGVVSFTPAFLARILAVLGPVTVAEYGETVTSANLIERFDFYTELEEARDDAPGAKKGFVASLGELVMDRLVRAPSSSWPALGGAVVDGFTAREAMAWATDPQVASALAQRGWDAAFPQAAGDFFYNGEFSYLAKNGRGLKRTFDHHVVLRPNGSARVTTRMSLANTEGRGLYNFGSLSFITFYGPEGAVLDRASDPPLGDEPPVADHPAVGYLFSVPPGEELSLTVVWEAPAVARKAQDGTWRYSLTWLRVPDHTGDVLNLRVDLPAGWRWKGAAPEPTIALDKDVKGSWALTPGKG